MSRYEFFLQWLFIDWGFYTHTQKSDCVAYKHRRGVPTTTPMPVSFPTGTFLTQLVAGYGSCAAIDNGVANYALQNGCRDKELNPVPRTPLPVPFPPLVLIQRFVFF